MRISDWSSDVCSSDLLFVVARQVGVAGAPVERGKAQVQVAQRTADGDVGQAVIHAHAVGLFAQAGVHGLEACRSEEHTSELQSLMRISYAVFCLKKKKYKS